jgi:hypothetical protein
VQLKGIWLWMPHMVRLGASVPTMQSCHLHNTPLGHSALVWHSWAEPLVAEAVAVHVFWHEAPAVIAIESAVPQHTWLPVQSDLPTQPKVAVIAGHAVVFDTQLAWPLIVPMQQLLAVKSQPVLPQRGMPASSYWTFVGTWPLLPPLLDDVDPESGPPLLLPELELEPELDPLDPEDELEPEEEEVDPPSSSKPLPELLPHAGSAAMTNAPERANAPHPREAEAGAMRTRRNCMIILREAHHITPFGHGWEEPGGSSASSPGLLVDSWPP